MPLSLSSAQHDLGALPEPLLAQIRARVGHMALLIAAVLLVAQLMVYVWLFGMGEQDAHLFSVHDDIVSLGIALLIYATTRCRRLSHLQVLGISRVLVFLMALSLSTLTHLNFFESFGRPPILTWVTVLTAVFPVLVPAQPRLTGLYATGLALTAPLGLWLARSLVGGSASVADYVAVCVHPAFAVGIAVVGSRLIYRRLTLLDVVEERQRLLDVVLENANLAVLLADADDQIVYANQPARGLLGPQLEQQSLTEALSPLSPALASAAKSDGQDLVVTELEGRREVLHVTGGSMAVGFAPHRLVLLRRMTAVVGRAEVAAYKRLIRIISHELSNTLGPVSSMLRSARAIVDRPEHRHRLADVLDKVGTHTERLSGFLERYIEYVRLPPPRPERVSWAELVARLQDLYPVRVEGRLPLEPAWLDAGQLMQVLTNLVKNAHEAEGPQHEVTIEVSARDGGLAVTVSDRGVGMSSETTMQAVLPFFTTKAHGTGLGLTLCAEIIEAHRGELRIVAREGGGTSVRCWLPQAESHTASKAESAQ